MRWINSFPLVFAKREADRQTEILRKGREE